MNQEEFKANLKEFLDELYSFLVEKNASYGGSVFSNDGIFSRTSFQDRLYGRIDDKLKRIKTLGPSGFGEDNTKDLIGYLAILLTYEHYQSKPQGLPKLD